MGYPLSLAVIGTTVLANRRLLTTGNVGVRFSGVKGGIRKLQHIPTSLDHANEFIAGAAALDFANTIGGTRDRVTHDHLVRYADLVVFAQQGGHITDALARRLMGLAKQNAAAAADVLHRGVRLRQAIWSVFAPTTGRPGPADLAIISDEAARAASHLRLARVGEGFAYGWSEDPELDRVLWPIAHSAAELLTSVNRMAVRECESETCSWLFLDRTRNHSRRWCDMGDCGNRAKARRYRARRVARRSGS